ncbi:MAG: valine--tRNA ligase [Saprospiraceae bacterium]|nr:valine--tRNA ligase [Saprospiraceae bacterium]MBP7699143.1 valine--tRNA ligase [Saprospiraceae bacterium]
MSPRYNPQEVENKWYQHWLQHNYFRSVPDNREPFTIVIPPPNVTGVLHMGHMLNNTIQDILIRRARLQGKNACWVPGTDHASIATEAKVVQMLRERGIKKGDVSREEFLSYAFEWKDKYGGIILDQLQKLGASCDWQRTRFTMEESLSKAVVKSFIHLYKKGKVYRGLRMTNWDPEAKTVLSNEEVIYKHENSQLFYVRYAIADSVDEYVTIATQRPETIMADTAVAVHPTDERYAHLRGKQVIVPLANRVVPIIFDDYVEQEFGTGALKVTPAHDPNDNELGKKHNLPVIDIINLDGTLNADCGVLELVGLDRFVARKRMKKMLEESGNLVKIEDYQTNIGRSERTNAVVEPKLTLQWFVDMKDWAATALNAVKGGDVRFFPEHLFNMYNNWLDENNIRDWCISRQLWWGQRIPAWYLKNTSDDTTPFVAETAEEALALAQKVTGNTNLTINDLQQDEDVFDTWFSSQLWPISVFDGFEQQDELRYYYPTNVLVTGWDIIFFWVARMIMNGYEWGEELLGKELAAKKGVMPFKDVYFTGMVRDNKRRKMSKSLGNSPDALALLDKYGADGVRFGMLSSAAAGNDIIFDAPLDPLTGQVLNESKLCEQGLNFCNKMWNALRLIKGWETTDVAPTASDALAEKWLEQKLLKVTKELEDNYQTYRLSENIIILYSFIWDDFCSWYLEMIKPPFGEKISQATVSTTIQLFEKLMQLLHPFMPFVTEEIWHQLKQRAAGDDCIISQYPTAQPFDNSVIATVEQTKDIISKVREIRNSKGLKMKDAIPLFIQSSATANTLYQTNGLKELVIKMANLSSFDIIVDEPANCVSFIANTDKLYVQTGLAIDVTAEKERITNELAYARGFVDAIQKKLSNERFVSGAPTNVVEMERKKLADGEARIKILTESLENLN